MAAKYPASLYVHDADASDDTLLQDEWNQVGQETEAIEAQLGTDIRVSTVTGRTNPSADARMESMESGVSAAGAVGSLNVIVRNDYGSNPDRVVRFEAELVMVEGYALRNLSQTCSLNVSGPGGLDIHTVAAETWYHLYEIYNPSNGNKNTLFSTSPNSPVTPFRPTDPVRATVPAGYTLKRRVGLALTDGSANLHRFRQVDSWWEMVAPPFQAANVAATSGVWNTYTVPSYYPPGPLTRYARFLWTNDSPATGHMAVREKNGESTGGIVVAHKILSWNGSANVGEPTSVTFDIALNESGEFEWKRDQTDANGNYLALKGLRYPMG